jgi:hypothetical protein
LSLISRFRLSVVSGFAPVLACIETWQNDRHVCRPAQGSGPCLGPQPINRPRLDLAWREDKVHGAVLVWDRADMPMRAGNIASDTIGSAMWEK